MTELLSLIVRHRLCLVACGISAWAGALLAYAFLPAQPVLPLPPLPEPSLSLPEAALPAVPPVATPLADVKVAPAADMPLAEDAAEVSERTTESTAVATPAPAAEAAPAPEGCGKKTYCSQMTTCAEARFHLTTCGLSRLDKDGDGTPCESLCK